MMITITNDSQCTNMYHMRPCKPEIITKTKFDKVASKLQIYDGFVKIFDKIMHMAMCRKLQTLLYDYCEDCQAVTQLAISVSANEFESWVIKFNIFWC